jgi:hypothetical protein
VSRLFWLAFSLFALTSCGGPTVDHGIVISRNDEPSFTVNEYECAAYYKTGACAFGYLQPYTYSEEWSLCLRADWEDKPAAQQDTGCVSVSQAVYGRYSVGDHYP